MGFAEEVAGQVGERLSLAETSPESARKGLAGSLS